MDMLATGKGQKRGCRPCGKKEYVDIPERTDIKAFLYIDRPGTIYINLSGAPKGIVKLIPKRPQPNNDRQGRNA